MEQVVAVCEMAIQVYSCLLDLKGTNNKKTDKKFLKEFI